MNHDHEKYDEAGSKLWILWVFILGFFAGFLVCFFAGDRVSKLFVPSPKMTSTTESAPPVEETIDGNETAAPPAGDNPRTFEETDSSDDAHNVVLSREARDRLLTLNLLSVLHEAEIKKYRFEGEVRGISINKIRTGSVLERLGFENGDIIESVNGVAVASLNKNKGAASTMLQELPGAKFFEVVLRRNEQQKTIKIKIADSAAQ